jgi:ADP-ribose pyrophosphatase
VKESCPLEEEGFPSSAYPDAPRLSVGAVVFKDNRVLLVQRGRPPGQGQWAIPGGKVNLGETLQAAAEREVLEETGIVVTALAPIYTFDMVERDDRGRVRFHYVIVDVCAEYRSGELMPGDDAAAVLWVAAEELARFRVNSRTRSLLRRTFGFGDE